MASSTLAWISLAVVITGIVLISLGLFLRSLARPWRRQLTHFRAGI